MHEKSISIKVTGKVQGVFFRKYTKEKAKSLMLKGFVRNESDGSVYIEVTGEHKAMEEFTEWCKQGPSSAKVDNVVVKEIEVQHQTSFQIKYF